MYPELEVPMMMFGKFRLTRTKKDKKGNKVLNKNGKKVMEKYWKEHNPFNGDPGVYPSVNRIYQRVSHGRQKLIKPAEDLMDQWSVLAKMWAIDNEWELTDDKVIIEMVAYFPRDNRKRDTHNVFKIMMDAFEGVLYKNDEDALPRVMDYKKVEEDQDPYFKLNIYKKEHENDVLYRKCGKRKSD